MTRRLFALARALIVAPRFISLWMYVVPRWIVGAHAFDAPRPGGWSVVGSGAIIGHPCAIRSSPPAGDQRSVSLRAQPDVPRHGHRASRRGHRLSESDDADDRPDCRAVGRGDAFHHRLRRTDLAPHVRRRLRDLLPQRPSMDSAAAPV